jgi:hypothetical protein
MFSRAGRYARNGFAVVGLMTVGTGYALTSAQKVSTHSRCSAAMGCALSQNGSVLVPVTYIARRVMQRMRKDLLQLPDQFVLELGKQDALCMHDEGNGRGGQHVYASPDVAQVYTTTLDGSLCWQVQISRPRSWWKPLPLIRLYCWVGRRRGWRCCLAATMKPAT